MGKKGNIYMIKVYGDLYGRLINSGIILAESRQDAKEKFFKKHEKYSNSDIAIRKLDENNADDAEFIRVCMKLEAIF